MDENTRRKVQRIIERGKKKAFHGNWKIYAMLKNEIDRLGIPTLAYEKAIKDLSKALGV